MKRTDRRRYDMLARVREFGIHHGHLLPESTDAKQLLEIVHAALAEVDARDRIAASASVATARKAQARAALMQVLARVAQTARVLSAGSPELKPQFELGPKYPDRRLVAIARHLLDQVKAHSGRFVAHGMAAGFITDFETLITTFDAAIEARGATREERVAARTRRGEALDAAMAAARGLDMIVANHLADDHVTQAVWKRERRIAYPKVEKEVPKTEAA
jgi:hypothetical protein